MSPTTVGRNNSNMDFITGWSWKRWKMRITAIISKKLGSTTAMVATTLPRIPIQGAYPSPTTAA